MTGTATGIRPVCLFQINQYNNFAVCGKEVYKKTITNNDE